MSAPTALTNARRALKLEPRTLRPPSAGAAILRHALVALIEDVENHWIDTRALALAAHRQQKAATEWLDKDDTDDGGDSDTLVRTLALGMAVDHLLTEREAGR